MTDSWKPRRTHKVKYFARFKGNIKHTRVQMRITEFKDAAFLDIRQFQTEDEGDTWQHTATGLSIHVKDLKSLREGVTIAINKAKELGLLEKYASDSKTVKKKKRK